MRAPNPAKRAAAVSTTWVATCSVGADAVEHDPHSAGEDLQIHPKREAGHVLPVVLHPLLEAAVRPTSHLPKTGDPWLHRETNRVREAVLLHLARQRRSRTYQAHLPPEDVQQLRQLVQAGTAKNAADPSHPRIAAHLEDGTFCLIGREELSQTVFRPDLHRSELVEAEALT